MAYSIDKNVVKTRLVTVCTTANLKVFVRGDREVKTTFGKVAPAVYILRQTMTSSNAGGSSSLVRQRLDFWLELGIVAPQYADGVVDNETVMRSLQEDVFLSMIGWQLNDFLMGFDLSTQTDGDPASAINYCIQKWHTSSMFQGVAR